jgi:hypothetical protein
VPGYWDEVGFNAASFQEVPWSLNASHFDRFRVYAPFVKTIVIDH